MNQSVLLIVGHVLISCLVLANFGSIVFLHRNMYLSYLTAEELIIFTPFGKVSVILPSLICTTVKSSSQAFRLFIAYTKSLEHIIVAILTAFINQYLLCLIRLPVYVFNQFGFKVSEFPNLWVSYLRSNVWSFILNTYWIL